jgi:hypothetical protein
MSIVLSWAKLDDMAGGISKKWNKVKDAWAKRSGSGE